jgi:hypothetical protein
MQYGKSNLGVMAGLGYWNNPSRVDIDAYRRIELFTAIILVAIHDALTPMPKNNRQTGRLRTDIRQARAWIQYRHKMFIHYCDLINVDSDIVVKYVEDQLKLIKE